MSGSAGNGIPPGVPQTVVADVDVETASEADKPGESPPAAAWPWLLAVQLPIGIAAGYLAFALGIQLDFCHCTLVRRPC